MKSIQALEKLGNQSRTSFWRLKPIPRDEYLESDDFFYLRSLEKLMNDASTEKKNLKKKWPNISKTLRSLLTSSAQTTPLYTSLCLLSLSFVISYSNHTIPSSPDGNDPPKVAIRILSKRCEELNNNLR